MASNILVTAISRGAWAVSVALMLLTIPIVIDVAVDRGFADRVWLPLLCIVGLLVLLGVSGWQPSTRTRLLYVLGGAALAIVYEVALLSADASLNDDASFVLNRPAMILAFAGVSTLRPLVGAAWSLAGYLLSFAVSAVASAVTGLAFVPGWGPTIAFVVYAGCYLALIAVRANQDKQVPDLARLEEDTRRLAIENQFEQRAAAIVHDTVLSDLTAIMNANGPLDERARARFRADVATLSDSAWLRESAEPPVVAPLDAVLRNALETLVSDFQWRGLSVDVTGDSHEVIRVSPEAASSLVLAVRACLDNVLDHAQTGSAELVISTTPRAVTIMVIDHGVGFDPLAVAGDRLGLRASVTARIRSHGGSVRVWSTPGSGTSVLISVPAAEFEQPSGAPHVS
ncbi:sensor histidine kinase [Conyzicola sp.]|uniref:sensor histidine kinase n=1 Tax=Conyzicola sp. TaxID=1969404 RepID=UPI003988D48F